MVAARTSRKKSLQLSKDECQAIERAFAYLPKVRPADEALWARIREHRAALARADAAAVADKYEQADLNPAPAGARNPGTTPKPKRSLR